MQSKQAGKRKAKLLKAGPRYGNLAVCIFSHQAAKLVSRNELLLLVAAEDSEAADEPTAQQEGKARFLATSGQHQ